MRSPFAAIGLALFPLALSGTVGHDSPLGEAGRAGAPGIASVQVATLLPAPTENPLDPGAEKRLKAGRRAWMEEMHWAAPGTDWRAIERENGQARMDARNRAVTDARPTDALARGATPWLEIGSRNLAGRMHAAVLSVSGDSLYAGSSRGGVWKADLSGNGWRPLSDNLWGGAHGLAVAGSPEIVTRITDGGEVHFTSDGGATWNVPGGAAAGFVEGVRVLSDPANPNRIYKQMRKIAGWGGNVGKTKVSEDAGLNYTLVRTQLGPRSDIWIDRVNGGRLWSLEADSLHYTDDAGATWSLAGTIPVAGITDVVLAGSEAGAPTFYAALETTGGWDLYRSTDAGVTWTWRNDIHDFWRTMASSITDPDIVMFGGVEMWRSTDGGANLTLVNGWAEYYGDPVNKLHADLPGLNAVWTPGGQQIHYVATDGGLYRSDDALATVTNVSLEKLGVSQYYTTHTSVNDPDLILAGAQDQGYQRTTGNIVGTLHDFDQLISGDYGHLTSSDGTHEFIYSDYPGFVLVQRGEAFPALTDYLDFPGDQNFSWIPYILADPTLPNAFFFCGNQIVRYRWRPFHLDWVMNFGTQDFTVNGGNYTTALAISAVDTDDRITITNNGLPWWSTDGGTTWTMSTDTGPSAHYFYGTAIEFSPTVAGEAYAGGSGYSGPGVYRTTDGGETWTGVGTGLPATLVYDLAYEGGASGVLYAATEAGPYRFDPGTDTWSSLDDATAPLTTYWCVESVPAAGVIRFGTYGRGIWDWQIQSTTSIADFQGPVEADDGIALLNAPNPFETATTLRFVTKRGGHVSLHVYDTAGRLVRELADGRRAAGPHEIIWDGRDTSGQRAAAGVYFARVESADGVAVRRVTRVR